MKRVSHASGRRRHARPLRRHHLVPLAQVPEAARGLQDRGAAASPTSSRRRSRPARSCRARRSRSSRRSPASSRRSTSSPASRSDGGDLIATIRHRPEHGRARRGREPRRTRRRSRRRRRARARAQHQALRSDGIISDAELPAGRAGPRHVGEEVAAAKDNLELVRRGVASRSGNTSNTLVALDDRRHGARRAGQGGQLGHRGQHLQRRHHHRHDRRHGRHDLRGQGRRVRGRQAEARHGARADDRRPRGRSFEADARAHRAQGRGGERRHPVRDPRGARAVQGRSDAFIRANYSANADIVLDRREKVLALNESLSSSKGEKRLRRGRDRAAAVREARRSRPGSPTASPSRSSTG